MRTRTPGRAAIPMSRVRCRTVVRHSVVGPFLNDWRRGRKKNKEEEGREYEDTKEGWRGRDGGDEDRGSSEERARLEEGGHAEVLPDRGRRALVEAVEDLVLLRWWGCVMTSQREGAAGEGDQGRWTHLRRRGVDRRTRSHRSR